MKRVPKMQESWKMMCCGNDIRVTKRKWNYEKELICRATKTGDGKGAVGGRKPA